MNTFIRQKAEDRQAGRQAGRQTNNQMIDWLKQTNYYIVSCSKIKYSVERGGRCC